jgi:ABC-type oligopeptide transport system substrate-binding subunit
MMKKLFTLTSILLLSLLLSACGEDNTKETEKKVTPPSDSYLDSRVNALNMAKESAKTSNEAVEKQNEMMEKLTK